MHSDINIDRNCKINKKDKAKEKRLSLRRLYVPSTGTSLLFNDLNGKPLSLVYVLPNKKLITNTNQKILNMQ